MKKIKLGFTLIELLIVITIIGILTAVVTTNLSSARSRARDARRKSDLRSIEQSLRLYYNDYKKFPDSDAEFKIDGCNTNPCSWGGAFSKGNGPTIYMTSLPTDPSSTTNSTTTYRYYSSSDDQYILQATLENMSDPDISESQNRCTTLYSNIKISNTSDYVTCVQ